MSHTSQLQLLVPALLMLSDWCYYSHSSILFLLFSFFIFCPHYPSDYIIECNENLSGRFCTNCCVTSLSIFTTLTEDLGREDTNWRSFENGILLQS